MITRRKLLVTSIAAIAYNQCGLLHAASDSPNQTSTGAKPFNPFDSFVKVTYTSDFMIVASDGIPHHEHGTFPNADNPNTIREQNYHFKIPLHPRVASKPVSTPFGPIGVAIDGIPFYNQYNAQGLDAVRLERFDSCCGHPDQAGRYHYHKYPTCIHSPFKDEPSKHSPLIGYMFDGYAIYGPNSEDGKPPADLDTCNGHTDAQRGYHYHVTVAYPYLIGGYHGIPVYADIDGGGRRNGPGGPPPDDFFGPPDGPPPGGPPPGMQGPPPGGPGPQGDPFGL